MSPQQIAGLELMDKLIRQKNTNRLKQFLFFVLCLSFSSLYAQEDSPYYVYGCENCQVTGLEVVGDYKILIYDSGSDWKHREMLLLNDKNLVVDKLKLDAPTDFVIHDEQRFSVRDLNYPALFKIENDKFQLETVYFFKAKFAIKKGFSEVLILKDYLWGQKTHFSKKAAKTNQVYSSFSSLSRKQPVQVRLNIVTDPKLHPYGLTRGDTLKTIEYQLNKDLKLASILDKTHTFPARGKRFGWHRYAVNGNKVYLYERYSQRFFKFDVSPSAILLQKQWNLPLENPEREGWKYYFDFSSQKHYFLKKEAAKSYILYHFDEKAENMDYLMSLDFVPSTIAQGQVFKTVTQDNSAEIYAYPLEKDKQPKKKLFLEEVEIEQNR